MAKFLGGDFNYSKLIIISINNKSCLASKLSMNCRCFNVFWRLDGVLTYIRIVPVKTSDPVSYYALMLIIGKRKCSLTTICHLKMINIVILRSTGSWPFKTSNIWRWWGTHWPSSSVKTSPPVSITTNGVSYGRYDIAIISVWHLICNGRVVYLILTMLGKKHLNKNISVEHIWLAFDTIWRIISYIYTRCVKKSNPTLPFYYMGLT